MGGSAQKEQSLRGEGKLVGAALLQKHRNTLVGMEGGYQNTGNS